LDSSSYSLARWNLYLSNTVLCDSNRPVISVLWDAYYPKMNTQWDTHHQNINAQWDAYHPRMNAQQDSKYPKIKDVHHHSATNQYRATLSVADDSLGRPSKNRRCLAKKDIVVDSSEQERAFKHFHVQRFQVEGATTGKGSPPSNKGSNEGKGSPSSNGKGSRPSNAARCTKAAVRWPGLS